MAACGELDKQETRLRMKTSNRLICLAALISVLAAKAANVPAPDDQEEPSVVANANGYFVV